jgi:hypothetical protein
MFDQLRVVVFDHLKDLSFPPVQVKGLAAGTNVQLLNEMRCQILGFRGFYQ